MSDYLLGILQRAAAATPARQAEMKAAEKAHATKPAGPESPQDHQLAQWLARKETEYKAAGTKPEDLERWQAVNAMRYKKFIEDQAASAQHPRPSQEDREARAAADAQAHASFQALHPDPPYPTAAWLAEEERRRLARMEPGGLMGLLGDPR